MTVEELEQSEYLLLKCISGSRAYGLDTAQSDTDIRGVFYLPRDTFYGMNYIPQISNDSQDIIYYELGRFIELLSKNNPNILELLFVPESCVLYRHPIMDEIKASYFLSKRCKETFAGYAVAQIQKARGLNKKITNPIEPQRKGILDFCFITDSYTTIPVTEWLEQHQRNQAQCGLIKMPHTKGLYALFYDEDSTRSYKGLYRKSEANELSLTSIPKGETMLCYLYWNMEAYSKYCKEYKDYFKWVEKRNPHRYEKNIEVAKHYDTKNMMHTIRLLQTALEIFKENKVNVLRPNRSELLSIRNGEWEYDDLIDYSKTLLNEINEAELISDLQNEPDIPKVNNLLVFLRSKLYRLNI